MYLLFIMASTFITCASGMPWWRNTIYAVVMLTSNGAVLFALHDGVVKTSSLVAGGLVLLLVILFLRWQELAARHRHRDVCIVKLANEVEVREKDILQNALAAVIPAPLVSTAISMWSSRQRRDGDVIRVERGSGRSSVLSPACNQHEREPWVRPSVRQHLPTPQLPRRRSSRRSAASH